MNIRYGVDLNEVERTQLAALLNGGSHAVRKTKRAQILLAADAGVSDEVIASSVSVGVSTVYRTRRRFVEGNLELAATDLLAAVPRPFAQAHGPQAGVVIAEPPLMLPRFEIRAVMPKAALADAGLVWLCDALSTSTFSR